MQAGEGLLMERVGSRRRLARCRQRIVLHGLEHLDILERRQVQAAARKHHVAAKQRRRGWHVVCVASQVDEAVLDIEADLRVGQKEVVPERVDAGDDVAIVGAVGRRRRRR